MFLGFADRFDEARHCQARIEAIAFAFINMSVGWTISLLVWQRAFGQARKLTEIEPVLRCYG